MKVLTGGYNRYKYEVYENSKTENLVDLTLIIRSECTLDDKLEIFLKKLKIEYQNITIKKIDIMKQKYWNLICLNIKEQLDIISL